MTNGLEWDQITAMATAAYNYFPNMSAKESAFFLMYGRDPVNKLVNKFYPQCSEKIPRR